ncbi:protein of unknown function [Methylorubrum extorquens]|uniref:Uncharacterized protein n=1 Tax=Methylorubrum extorquens TaxID=408 RepID=A0A2N9AMK7_METEX|nr:protein of unknown function [Methylorubrum extorquens]
MTSRPLMSAARRRATAAPPPWSGGGYRVADPEDPCGSEGAMLRKRYRGSAVGAQAPACAPLSQAVFGSA